MGRDYLLEIGCEEIPAGFVGPALWFGGQQFEGMLKKARLTFRKVDIYGTPRRLAIHVLAVADVGEDVKKEVQGPSVKAAFKDGVAQVPAKKFAESVGLTVEQLKRVTTPKGEYLAATVEEKGKQAAEIQG